MVRTVEDSSPAYNHYLEMASGTLTVTAALFMLDIPFSDEDDNMMMSTADCSDDVIGNDIDERV